MQDKFCLFSQQQLLFRKFAQVGQARFVQHMQAESRFRFFYCPRRKTQLHCFEVFLSVCQVKNTFFSLFPFVFIEIMRSGTACPCFVCVFSMLAEHFSMEYLSFFLYNNSMQTKEASLCRHPVNANLRFGFCRTSAEIKTSPSPSHKSAAPWLRSQSTQKASGI